MKEDSEGGGGGKKNAILLSQYGINIDQSASYSAQTTHKEYKSIIGTHKIYQRSQLIYLYVY